MALLDVSFPWRVCGAGYEAITRKGKGGTLAEGAVEPGVYIVPKRKRWRAKYPLQFNTALYRIFANLDGTADACVEFANRFGLLVCDNDPDGYPLARWQRHIADMRKLIAAWEADPTTLAFGDRSEIKVGEMDAVVQLLPPDGRLALRVRPRTLLAGMQIQLAAAVADGLEIRRCDQCSQLFEIGPGGRRSQSRFCSKQCQINFNNAKKHRRTTR